MPKELGDYLLKLDVMHKPNIMIKHDLENNTEIKDDEKLTIYDDSSKESIKNTHFTNNYKYDIDDTAIIK